MRLRNRNEVLLARADGSTYRPAPKNARQEQLTLKVYDQAPRTKPIIEVK